MDVEKEGREKAMNNQNVSRPPRRSLLRAESIVLWNVSADERWWFFFLASDRKLWRWLFSSDSLSTARLYRSKQRIPRSRLVLYMTGQQQQGLESFKFPFSLLRLHIWGRQSTKMQSIDDRTAWRVTWLLVFFLNSFVFSVKISLYRKYTQVLWVVIHIPRSGECVEKLLLDHQTRGRCDLLLFSLFCAISYRHRDRI